ncbi:MAG: hypothetical protein ACREPQ_09690 [Rhodanobacter sp.]
MKPDTLAFLQRILAKLNQKSSVYAYAMVFASAFASKYQGTFATAAALISAGAGIVLFILNDAQVRAWLTGQTPDAPKSPTVPPPKG